MELTSWEIFAFSKVLPELHGDLTFKKNFASEKIRIYRNAASLTILKVSTHTSRQGEGELF